MIDLLAHPTGFEPVASAFGEQRPPAKVLMFRQKHPVSTGHVHGLDSGNRFAQVQRNKRALPFNLDAWARHVTGEGAQVVRLADRP